MSTIAGEARVLSLVSMLFELSSSSINPYKTACKVDISQVQPHMAAGRPNSRGSLKCTQAASTRIRWTTLPSCLLEFGRRVLVKGAVNAIILTYLLIVPPILDD